MADAQDDAAGSAGEGGAPAAESKVERAKRQGHALRGTLAATLASDAPRFGDDDVTLLKFHGSYQQDDRDVRRARAAAGAERAWSFMVRVALPGGAMTADQYLAFDRLAGERADGTLRITTRQGFQFHGVVKGDLRPAIAAINANLATTLAACGDVSRNVMAPASPADDAAHAAARRVAQAVAVALRPASRAYHELWIDGEAVDPDTLAVRETSASAPVPAGAAPAAGSASPPTAEEPFYGTQYLPRKFKVGVALSTDNTTDVYAQDVGLVGVVGPDGALLGFDVLVGGGLGMTANKADTIAQLGQPLGMVAEADAAEAARLVAAIFRDHGNRADRRHSRLKYLLAEWGIERFRDEFVRRAAFPLLPWAPLPDGVPDDHLGRRPAGGGRWHYGVFVQSGRIADRDTARLRTALRAAVEELRPGVVLTPQQNLLLTGLPEAALARVEAILEAHGVTAAEAPPPVRRHSMACPALPTCGLAVAESERALPGILDRLQPELARLGLADAPLTVRSTGCPNGCARPYTADLAFVGRSLGLYHVYVGGSMRGDRLADLYASDVKLDAILDTVRPLLEAWGARGAPGEPLGDFYQRVLGRTERRQQLTGREEPSAPAVAARLPLPLA